MKPSRDEDGSKVVGGKARAQASAGDEAPMSVDGRSDGSSCVPYTTNGYYGWMANAAGSLAAMEAKACYGAANMLWGC